MKYFSFDWRFRSVEVATLIHVIINDGQGTCGLKAADRHSLGPHGILKPTHPDQSARWNGSTSSVEINWLVADHLGTPRMIFDQTGSLAATKRHDYLPFGEELTTQSGRSTAQGYAADDTRQKFTSKERDIETGLDYFLARL